MQSVASGTFERTCVAGTGVVVLVVAVCIFTRFQQGLNNVLKAFVDTVGSQRAAFHVLERTDGISST